MRISFQWCYLLCLCQSLAAFSWMPMANTRSRIESKSILAAASSSSDSDGRRKNRTAAQQERIEEERRRLSRKNDVVIGKTSAMPGAKDFELNVQKTEMEWRQQATPIECQIREYTQKAMDALHMYRLKDAKEAFDFVYELKPDAYCWHKGIVEYYLGDYEEASNQFQQNAIRFENKYGEPASEERIWACATHLKYRQYHSKNKVLPPLAYILPMDEDVPKERRKVMRIARDLFECSLQDDSAGVAMARARLRATAVVGQEKKLDYKLWKLSSWYYLGLHYDAIGQEKDAQQCMKMAIQQCSPASRDIIHTLPILHMIVRDWFDDDEFSDPDPTFSPAEDPNTNTIMMDNFSESDSLFSTASSSSSSSSQSAESSSQTVNTFSQTKAGRTQAALQSTINTSRKKMDQAVIIQSIQDTVMKMKLVELRAALKKRELKNSGAKQTLQERLLRSMMDDLHNEM